MILVGDIEADGLLHEASRIWMIVLKDITNDRWIMSIDEESLPLLDKSCYPKGNVMLTTHTEVLRIMQNAQKVVFHNFMGYDYPLLQKFYPEFNLDIPRQVDDTFVMSSLLSPDRAGGHSLSSWGSRLGYDKGCHDEWDKFSKEMLEYCVRDVELCSRVYRTLTEELKDEYKLRIEHGVHDSSDTSQAESQGC